MFRQNEEENPRARARGAWLVRVARIPTWRSMPRLTDSRNGINGYVVIQPQPGYLRLVITLAVRVRARARESRNVVELNRLNSLPTIGACLSQRRLGNCDNVIRLINDNGGRPCRRRVHCREAGH